MEENIVLIDDLSIRDKIHTIRGVKVMLDFDLAEIYGYKTRDFSLQIKHNSERFEGDDFSFVLSDKEFKNLMSKKSTSSWGGRRKNPRAFTESGIYMLMTVFWRLGLGFLTHIAVRNPKNSNLYCIKP